MRAKGSRKKGGWVRQLVVFGLGGLLFSFGLIIIISTIGRKELGPVSKLALDLSAPLFRATEGFSSSIATFKRKYLDLLVVAEEKEQLYGQLKESRAEVYKYREALATNARLRKLLEFKELSALPMVGARVVGKDPALWFRTIVIDRGEKDGVLQGMPVVNGEGIVGQVLRVSPGYSKVLLAIAPSSAIDVVLQKSRARGILKGDGTLMYRLEYILKNVEVSEGDLVVSAGYGGIFPQGLPVGEVSRVGHRQRGMFQEIEVKPSVDFMTLENLLVIEQQHPFVD